MRTSLLKELPFKIGEQYELNEFHLKTLKSTFNNGLEYENYEYIKSDLITIFDLQLENNITLKYNGDLLIEAVYVFNINSFNTLINKLNDYLTVDNLLDLEKIDLREVFTIYNFAEIKITLKIQKHVKLTIFKSLGQT